MVTFSTTRLTSRGQIVIPEDIRKRLGLKEGMQFIVMGEGDAIILRAITPPTMKDFGAILEKTARAAKEEGMKQSDINESVKRYRSKKNKQ